MKLVLKNIGMLKDAELTLQPLCVIAGENDNGKSTVGKIIFCIIKAINRYKEDLRVSRETQVDEKLEEIFFTLRRGLKDPTAEQDSPAYSFLVSFFSAGRFPGKTNEKIKAIEDTLRKFELDQKSRETVEELLRQAKELASAPEDPKQSIAKAFVKIFAAEFDSNILFRDASEGFIKLSENDIPLIDLKIDRDNKVTLLSDVEPIEIKDATFIETPLVLNNHDLLLRSQTLLDMTARRAGRLGLAYTTLHTKDLFDKLRVPFLPVDNGRDDTLVTGLQQIVDGRVAYDRSKNDFVFARKEQSISIKNTASGIKIFGLLQILLANELIKKNTFVIFDEPENHLHPKWQLKLAEVIVELARSGVFIFVSSHSPYMIEALQRYSKRAGLEDRAGFFLARNNQVQDRSCLSEIFELLSQPFDEFRKMDGEALADE